MAKDWKSDVLPYLTERMEGADRAAPSIGVNGDRFPVTLHHHVVDEVFAHEPYSVAPEWEFMRSERRRAAGQMWMEYPGKWVRALIKSLTAGTTAKEG